MFSAAKFGLSTLVALVLLLTPIGFCATAQTELGNPAHPCCPAKPLPLPDDCAQPAGMYLHGHERHACCRDGNSRCFSIC